MSAPVFSTACLDWEDRIIKGEPLVPFGPIFKDVADDHMRLFEYLPMPDAVGFADNSIGALCKPWFKSFASTFFGTLDLSTGERLVSEFLILISKKNGKSTKAAGLMLTILIKNFRRNAEFAIIAPTKEIADNAFEPASAMIDDRPDIATFLHVQPHLRKITHLETGATLRVIAADKDSLGGSKFTGVFIDELWLFGQRSSAEAMLQEATGGLVSRPEGFVIYATTQSDKAPTGTFKSKLQYARDVRDGKIKDNHFMPILYEFPKRLLDKEAHLDPDYFYITNPNMGASVSKAWLERKIKENLAKGQHELQLFLSKHLNVEIGLALAGDRWAGVDQWESCKDERVDFNYLIERSKVITVGIDGGGLDDLLGLSFVGVDATTGDWLTCEYAWVHESVPKVRRKSEAALLEDLQQEGYLTIYKNVGEDVQALGALIKRVFDSGKLGGIGADPAGIEAILRELEDVGIDRDMIVGVKQGWTLISAIKLLERLLARGVLKHGGTDLMRWCVGNAKIRPSANAVLITKQESGTGKIDPLMALLNAVELMSRDPKPLGSLNDSILNWDLNEVI